MRSEFEKARRHAENTLAEVNEYLNRSNVTNARQRHMLADMAEKATRTLENLDRLNNARPYADTNIGYNANARSRSQMTNDVNDLMNTAMDAVDRLIPFTDDMDDRRGVPGTGRGRRRRSAQADRYDMAEDFYDDDMDDADDADARRGRPRRTRRGVGRWTQVRGHVRRMPRRSEMDDYADDAHNDNMRYDDDHYDEMRRMVDEARRMADDARRSADDARNAHPVMARSDNARSDRSNDRYDARNDRMDRSDRSNDRYDDRGDDRSDARSIGPRG